MPMQPTRPMTANHGPKDSSLFAGITVGRPPPRACWVRRKRLRAGRSHVDGSVTSVGECAIIHKRTQMVTVPKLVKVPTLLRSFEVYGAVVGEGANIVKANQGHGTVVGESAKIIKYSVARVQSSFACDGIA